MTEAMNWSVFTWLFEKRKVRDVADQANAVLDKLNRNVKSRWSEDLKAAYKELRTKAGQDGDGGAVALSQIRRFVKEVKAADAAARRARMTAEATFDEADRQLNTDMAREGCRQAIHSWELHEMAIRKAEAVPDSARADD